jgi:uncharacterized protein with GYD domain
MVTYVVLAKFTDQGIRNAKESPKRAEAFKQLAKTFGVTVKDIFWTQGRYDTVTIVEAPDESSAMSLSLSLGALGNIRTESLRAFGSGHGDDCRQDGLTTDTRHWRRRAAEVAHRRLKSMPCSYLFVSLRYPPLMLVSGFSRPRACLSSPQLSQRASC